MEKYEIQRLRDLPIEQVAQRLGIGVARHRALCPFHSDHHASLSFSTRRNSCRCFVCMQQGMGTIDLAMRILGVSFPKACRWLADTEGVYLSEAPAPPRSSPDAPRSPSFDAARYARFFEHPWLSPEARRFLFEERRIDPRVAAWCRLTSWQDHGGTHWLQIPYFSTDGKLVGVQNRNLDHGKDGKMEILKDGKMERWKDGKMEILKDGKMERWKDGKMERWKDGKMEKPRFRFPRGAKCGIYNLPVINRLKAGDELYITEGCSDCWAMLSSGRKAIAVPSATLLQPEDKRLLADLGERLHLSWHMYPDRDAPGESLFLQLKELLPNLHHHQLPPGCKDFAERWKDGKMERWKDGKMAMQDTMRKPNYTL